IDRREDMAAIEFFAEARIGAIAFAPAMFGDRRKAARLEAVEVVAGQDVDHTRHGIRAIDRRGAGLEQIGRAHVRTPVTNAHLVCRLLLEKKKNTPRQYK